MKYQRAFGIQLQILSAVEAHIYFPGIGAWSHRKIILKASLVGVENQINAVIDIGILDARVSIDASNPFCRIIADEIIRANLLRLLSEDQRRRVRAIELHAQ